LTILVGHLPEGQAELQEVLGNTAVWPGDVETEETAAIAAIRRQHDSMRSGAFELFNKACYGGQPYGFAPHGEAETISRFEAPDLQDWWQSHVRAGGAIIGITGNMDGEELGSLL